MTMQPWSLQMVVECDDPHELATWWAEALGWDVEAQDEVLIQSMLDQGFAQESDVTTYRGTRVWVAGAAINHPDGLPPRLLFQRVPEAKSVKNRVHWDLRPPVGSTPEDVERLVTMGGRRIGEGQQGPHTWVVMADPEGNEFCV